MQLCLFDPALHLGQHRKALVALGIFGPLLHRQHRVEFHRKLHGVDELALGGARMDAHAVHAHGCCRGVEVLILDLADGAAVGSVSEVCAKALDVKQICAAADLLVWRKADADGRVRRLIGHQLLNCGEDLRNTGLVVGAEQGSAVGDDKMLAHAALELGEVRRAHHNALFFIQHNVAAKIFHDPRLDLSARAVGRGIHVCDQADHRAVFHPGDRAIDVSIFIHMGVGNAHSQHFLHNGPAEQLLLVGGRAGGAFLVRLGVEGNVV